MAELKRSACSGEQQLLPRRCRWGLAGERIVGATRENDEATKPPFLLLSFHFRSKSVGADALGKGNLTDRYAFSLLFVSSTSELLRSDREHSDRGIEGRFAPK